MIDGTESVAFQPTDSSSLSTHHTTLGDNQGKAVGSATLPQASAEVSSRTASMDAQIDGIAKEDQAVLVLQMLKGRAPNSSDAALQSAVQLLELQ